jgi:class 3 adenylate cyclase
MTIKDDLEKEVKKIFSDEWATRDGQKVPETEDLKLSNDAVKIQGVVLYADLAESTNLVDKKKAHFAAEIYKTYLHCASKVIRNEGGVITAFDGDRVMGVFIGGEKNTSAARCALKINYAVTKIINPAIKAQYPKSDYKISHCVGVDACELFVARTGVRGSNDLVWVGRAANYAAKLCSLRTGNYVSYITETVYKSMMDSVKFSSPDKKPMWEKRTWTAKNINVYRSSWTWTI